MIEASNVNFVYGTGEIWYCFLSMPAIHLDRFDQWMVQNLPSCKVFRFGEDASAKNYEIHGNTAAERMLFAMRWT